MLTENIENKAVAAPDLFTELAALEAARDEAQEAYNSSIRAYHEFVFGTSPQTAKERERNPKREFWLDAEVQEAREVADAAQVAITAHWRRYGAVLSGKDTSIGPSVRMSRDIEEAQLARLRRNLAQLGVKTRG